MKDWLRASQRLNQMGPSVSGLGTTVNWRRRSVAALITTAAVAAAKLGAGPALGRQAPFVLLGLGVLGAGWVAGAGGALLSTVLLTVVSEILFFPPYGSFQLTSPTAFIQLATFFCEGVAISGIVAAMDRARHLHQQTAHRMEALQVLTAALAAARSTAEVSQTLIKGTVAFLGAAGGILVLPTDDGRGLRTVTRQGNLPGTPPPERDVVAVSEQTPFAAAFRSGETEWIENRATYVEKYPQARDVHDAVPAAVASLPLYAAGRVIGAASFYFSHARPFPESERSVLRGYVTQTAQALDRTLSDAREADALRRLDALANVSIALSAAATTQEVSDIIVARGTSAMGADTCTLYMVTGADPALELLGHRGVAPEVLENVRRITRESGNPAYQGLLTGQSVWGESEGDYATLFPRLAAIQTEAPRAQAFWSVPLIVEGHPIGLLGMGFYRARRFSTEERSFIETFTGNCAQAMVRARRLDTEQQARRLAERAEASLATTLRSIGDAVIATDVAGNVTFMNAIAESLTGWSAEEARGRPLVSVFRIVNEHTRKEVESPVQRVLDTGIVVGLANHTLLLNRVEGIETPIDDSGAPIRDEAGQVQGVVLVFRDVTEKKRREERRFFLTETTETLASSLDYQTTLVRVAQLMVPRFADWAAVDVLDSESSTPRRLAVAHVDPQKVALAHELARRYPDLPDAPYGLPNVLRTGRSELYSEISDEMTAASARDAEHLGLLRSLSLRSAMIVPLVARGRTLGAISLVQAESRRHYGADDLAFMEDIARRAAVVIDNAQLYASEREARRAADLANRTKDEFLATVSHELRTPLNAILGWARMMAKTPENRERTARAIEVIERNSVAMTGLIEDLLDVSRIISGKVRLDVQPLNPSRVVQAALDAVRPSFEAKELQVRAATAAEPDNPEPVTDARTVWGDSGRLQQVLCNLLSNAIKFTPNGGRVDVSVRRTASWLEIDVSDSGKGIEPEFLPHVFEPFRQADGSITRAHSGLGLGLAISRHLVELHGGRMRAESAGLGQGAQFTVSLPFDQVPEQPATLTPGAAQEEKRPPGASAFPERRPSTLQGLRVLAVDDDVDARQLVRSILEEQGAHVTLAGSVSEALSSIALEMPDVLLSDVGMPNEDGFSLIRRIRSLADGRGSRLPAAALTAYTRVEDRRNVLAAGFSAHLAKPIEPERLISLVETLATGKAKSEG